MEEDLDNGHQNLVITTKLAKILGVAHQRVSELKKKRFKDALVGDKFNVNHPVIQEYIEYQKGIKAATGQDKVRTGVKDAPILKTEITLPTEVGEISFHEIENLTIKEVVMRYGTVAGFKNYLDALKVLADWKNKELKFLKDRGKVVDIKSLADSLFSLVDLAFTRIVGEFPGAIAPQLKAVVQAGKDDDIIQMVGIMEKELSQIIKNCKSKIIRDLEAAKKKAKIN